MKLASTGSPLPLAPGDDAWWLELIGSGGSPAPNALAAAAADVGTLQQEGGLLPPLFGPGGFLIGDGLDADPETCTAPCNGGNGGLLWGNGGDGALGGNGGNGGFLR